MLVPVTYDVSTTDRDGQKRLRHVAKVCLNYGQRVQNSVFECHVDYSQSKILKAKLLEIIDEKQDSIRFYDLGNNYQNRVEHYGIKESYDMQNDVLML